MSTIFDIKRDLKNGASVVVYDLETTGFKKPESRILSFSAIKYVEEDGDLKELARKNIFINPGFHIPDDVTAINHISDDDVKDCPTENMVADEIINFLNDTDYVTGYNQSTFDDWFIDQLSQRCFGKEWKPKQEFDILKLVREKLKKGKNGVVESHSLGAIAAYLGVCDGLEFHNSIDDVIATARVFWKVKDMYEDISDNPIPLAAVLWEKGESLRRLYINNTQNMSVYYDIPTKTWVYRDVDVSFIDEVLKPFGTVEALLETVKSSPSKRYCYD